MINYINNNYKKIEDICRIYVKRKDDYIIDDLMATLIDEFIDKNYQIKDDEKFFYIIRIIINLVNNKTSKFNKRFIMVEEKINDVFYIDDTEYEPETSIYNDEYDFKIEEKIINIRNLVDILFKNKEISLIEKNSFLFYYYPEEKINIKNMELSEIRELRKISYRKLSKRSRKNYQQIRFNVLKVTELIEKMVKNDLN